MLIPLRNCHNLEVDRVRVLCTHARTHARTHAHSTHARTHARTRTRTHTHTHTHTVVSLSCSRFFRRFSLLCIRVGRSSLNVCIQLVFVTFPLSSGFQIAEQKFCGVQKYVACHKSSLDVCCSDALVQYGLRLWLGLVVV